MFRINSRCISCGTCWQFNPEHFANGGDAAVVCHQPQALPSLHRALLALQACPVAAIEASAEQRRQGPDHGFPVPVTRHRHGEVMYCGWASKRSFGACSWLIRRPGGNVMVDVPRWSAPLARRIKALGGLAAIVLTHRDDVADHARWARAFGAERWIHGADGAAAPEAERQVVGDAPGPIIAASDYMKCVPDMVSRWLGDFTPLGTNGYGRSDTREALRRHFEVDPEHIVVTTLWRLAELGELDRSVVQQAISDFGLDPAAIEPSTL